ncbi:hypothetical protein F511_34429 [Dorcoceras hygrometricum]|uniref:Uncharacterized protein n=1 Tax=Dorcoceras hygrometricum TaxID=472368 RepID=A0A2Z7B514_9LAMI|nr:hypothetical protein F511_34429 [Dorcoceras hygrometricum]
MVTPSSKQARGFAVHICIILKVAPNLEFGKSKAFPTLKIFTAKNVGTYIAKNKSINAEEVLEVPVEKMFKKAATKRRPAPDVVEPTAKKKRTTVGRAAHTEKNLALVTVVQDFEPISVVPAVSPSARRRRAPKRKLVLRGESDDETVENIIKQVITETAEIETEEMETVEPVVMETTEIEIDETESRIDVSSITNYDEDSSLKVLSNEEGPLVETEKEKEKEKEKENEMKKEKIMAFKVTTLLALVPGSNRNYKNAGSSSTCVTLNGSGIQLAVGPQPLWLRNYNSGLAHRIMVKRLETSPHDPLGITDSACKNQLVVVSVQYGPFNPYIPIRSTTIGKSRVAIDPIAMHTSWRSNSDITSATR